MAAFHNHAILSWMLLAAFGAVPLSGQTYTASQATAGRAVYLVHCANCHLADLAGRNEAPQLAGGNFMNVWGPRPVNMLFTYLQSTMPPNNRGGLGEEAYLNLTAFLLEANGARDGNQPLQSASR